MDNYSQHMKHWRNHRKDRYFQQCSGYGGGGESEQVSEELRKQILIKCFEKIINEVNKDDFPIYVRICCDEYMSICNEKDLFGNKINTYEELLQFGNDYVY